MKNLILLAVVVAMCGCAPKDYKDATLPVEERVEALLSQMTLEEKVGQMSQYCGVEHVRVRDMRIAQKRKKIAANDDANAYYPGINADTLLRWTEEGKIGSYLHVLTVEEANMLQEHAMRSRLGIPLIFGIDAIHGNALAPDNTNYPTNIGLACSFNPDMAYKIARQTAKEMRAMNMHWTFNPNVDVARDGRWGRCGETYGEDTYLVGSMGVASVKGYQGNLDSQDDVLACIKHLIAGSQSVNGSNAAPTDVSERTLREVFLPPYERCLTEVKAGSLMTAHNEISGIPCHASKWLMEDVMRGECGFEGFVVSDWMDIERLHNLHAVAENRKEAFYQSIMAGMDMHMHGIYWFDEVIELVREGRIPESRIDESVRRILTAKFRLGLFENPYADVEQGAKVRLCEEHRQTALEAARQSIVLVKNDGILPLDVRKYKRVMVTGVNADDQGILGDWSSKQRPENVTTILEGLREVAPQTEFVFVDQGVYPNKMKQEKVDEAVRKSRTADLNIVVVGEQGARYMKGRTCGENRDRANIELLGLQEELVRRVAASGKPTIMVVVAGRPQNVEWADENLPAILYAWEPGMYGGQAVAEILYGKVNPSAKMSMTIPRGSGQIGVYYNYKPSHYFHKYLDQNPYPLYHFGYGLSYTTFEYSDLALSTEKISADGTVDVEVTITNTGERDGVEIAQLYIRDCYSSVTRPVKELKDFARVELKAGESKLVKFTITPDKLQFYNADMQRIVEPGEFKVMVGSSSRDEDLMTASFVVE